MPMISASAQPMGTQQVCKVVIQKSSHDAQKDDEQVFLHQGAQLLRHPQHPQDAVQSQIHQHVQHQRNARNEDERKEHALPHPVLLTAAILHGNGRAAAHAQAQQNRGKKGHKGIGRAHCRQRVCAKKAAYHPCPQCYTSAAADCPASAAGQTAECCWWWGLLSDYAALFPIILFITLSQPVHRLCRRPALKETALFLQTSDGTLWACSA